MCICANDEQNGQKQFVVTVLSTYSILPIPRFKPWGAVQQSSNYNCSEWTLFQVLSKISQPASQTCNGSSDTRGFHDIKSNDDIR